MVSRFEEKQIKFYEIKDRKVIFNFYQRKETKKWGNRAQETGYNQG